MERNRWSWRHLPAEMSRRCRRVTGVEFRIAAAPAVSRLAPLRRSDDPAAFEFTLVFLPSLAHFRHRVRTDFCSRGLGSSEPVRRPSSQPCGNPAVMRVTPTRSCGGGWTEQRIGPVSIEYQHLV